MAAASSLGYLIDRHQACMWLLCGTLVSDLQPATTSISTIKGRMSALEDQSE